ncbi:MAG: flagellar basal body P-ring protein FlgI [Planctomycetaceae bacterium]|nr:flagellar basal body P-ring protein FlgI [Planctomycetaceae bacterium]
MARMSTWWAAAGMAAVLLTAGAADAERIKDIVDIKGVRGNPVWGYGLVIGLNGTGDNGTASKRALANVLRRTGLVLSPEDLASKNIASVLVTADLPPFARSGGKIDVTVSAIGNCGSLQGGTLLVTELVAADGQVYAVASGQLSVGGFGASGAAASVSKNHPTVGRIPNGGTIERDEVAIFVRDGYMTLQLKNPDFSTAQAIAKAINEKYPEAAAAIDAAAVRVSLAKDAKPAAVTDMVTAIEALSVTVDTPAVVVIDSRNGTIVVGENVAISAVAIAHGNLAIVTQEKESVSQPAPFAKVGNTEKVKSTQIDVVEEKGTLNVLRHKVSVAELARALNALGLTPRDLISIFEALRQAGALQAELKVI